MDKYNVCDNEGTLIKTVEAYDLEHAIEIVSEDQGIEKCYLRARKLEEKSPIEKKLLEDSCEVEQERDDYDPTL